MPVEADTEVVMVVILDMVEEAVVAVEVEVNKVYLLSNPFQNCFKKLT